MHAISLLLDATKAAAALSKRLGAPLEGDA